MGKDTLNCEAAAPTVNPNEESERLFSLVLFVLHFLDGLLYVKFSLGLGLRQSGSLLVNLLTKLSHSAAS